METSYLDRNTRSPAAMAAVVAIHAAGIAGLILFAPTVTKTVETILIGRNIPLTPDPPENVKAIKPEIETTTPQRIDQVEKEVEIGTATGGFTRDPGPLTGGEGTGTIEIVTPPIDPPHDPVLVGPRLTPRNVQPPYPPGMQRLGIEGAVTVRVLVGTDGRAMRIEAVKADDDAFFAATRDWGLKHWRFAPATRDGVPYEAWRTMTVRFTMDGVG